MKEYNIIIEKTPKDLELLINGYLDLGYLLSGGICVNVTPFGTAGTIITYSQAIYKPI